MYLCVVLDLSILHISTILIFVFGIVPTVFVFNFIHTSHFSLTRESELVFIHLVWVFFLSDGKSKSNKESILRNWKTLKQIIAPVDFVRELEKYNFLQQSSFENLGNKSRSHQATLVLIKVYRKVQSSEEEYEKFVKILRHKNSPAADALSNAVGGPINNPGTTGR